MDDTVIPPVAAGTLDSCITLVHDHDINRDDTKKVTATHEWAFDLSAYNYHTGLDLGADYPYVPQENGHTLLVRRDCEWNLPVRSAEQAQRGFDDESSNPNLADTENDVWYRLSVEETWRTDARSGSTVHYSYYSIEVDYDGHIVNFDDEAFDYNGERNERFDPRLGGEIYDGSYAGDPMQLVRTLHFGTQPFAQSPDEQIRFLLEADSPDDAIPVSEYKRSTEQTNDTVTADD